MFSDLTFPFPEFQVGRVAFDDIIAITFSYLTLLVVPKPCQRFMKGRFVCTLQTKPRNSTFVIESGGVQGPRSSFEMGGRHISDSILGGGGAQVPFSY